VASANRPPHGGLARLRRSRLVLDAAQYAGLKDPCPVRVGGRWHLFGTAVHEGYRYEILHATARTPAGPWRLHPPSALDRVTGACVAAPGVIADGEVLHMFLQTDYNVLGGRVEHLVSTDGGASFTWRDTALTSLPGTAEAGVYDPHPCQVAGERYLVYSGFSVVGRPDIYLARGTGGGWDGPWERLGRILDHDQVPEHNQHDDPRYEWGLEGGQLVELPDGRVLLNAVCFLAAAEAGNRQRVFFALAPHARGPYEVVGCVLAPDEGPGEIGHATVVIHDGELTLFFQERAGDGRWGYGLATAPLGRPEPGDGPGAGERRLGGWSAS
jgi:hypothetical protein